MAHIENHILAVLKRGGGYTAETIASTLNANGNLPKVTNKQVAGRLAAMQRDGLVTSQKGNYRTSPVVWKIAEKTILRA